ncbi:MAG TPA: glutamine cyclotransferase [Polyangiaceae bacterium]
MKNTESKAEIVAEYGPFDGVEHVHGVTFDGERVWFAFGAGMLAFDPRTKKETKRLDVAADAGTAFDGKHLWQLAGARIQKIDPETGNVVGSIPAPGAGKDSGLTWAEGTLWVGQYRDKKIHKIDPETGAILRTIESDKFVTGVTWADGELWHATIDEDQSDIRRVDQTTGEVLERLVLPKGKLIAGLEAGPDAFYAGSHETATVRAVKRPRRVA